MKVLKKCLSGIIFLLLLLITVNYPVDAIGVQPLTLDFEMSPGETEEFTITFSSSGREENVNISIYQCYQDYTGNLNYREGDLESFPEIGWITLDNNHIRVPADEDMQVNGSIRIPFGVRGGSYPIILMVEPEPGKTGDGISLVVRYAVRLIIRVDGPALRERGKINFLQLQQDENGEQVLLAQVQNTSQLDYLTGVEVTIRDETRKLIERITLRTISGQKNMRDLTRVYPGSEVLFVGWPDSYLYPGEYELRALMNYGDRGRDTYINNITILPGQFKEPDKESSDYYSLKPERIIDRLGPGQRVSEAIEIRNIYQDNIYIRTELKEVEENYNYSLLPWLKLYTNEDNFKLLPRQPKRFLKMIQIPPDVEAGGYYALLNIKVYSNENMLSLLDDYTIPITCIVGNTNQNLVEIETDGFHKIDSDGKIGFAISLRNTGKIHIKPTVKLSLFSDEEKLIEEIELNSDDLIDEFLLPDKELLYKGMINKHLEKGDYNILIEIFNENDSIQKLSYEIVIENIKEI